MTLKEAKDKLKKEGFRLEGPGKPHSVSEDFTELESPDICEAMQIVCSAGYSIMMLNNVFNARKARLKEQLEEHSNAPMSGSPALTEAASQFNDALLDEQAKKIEKLTKENEDWKSWHEMQKRAIAINNIAFRNEKNRLGKEIARLNKIIHKKNMKIEELKKELADKIDAQALKSAESALACKEQLIYYKDKIIANNKKKIAEKDEVIADLGKELAATKKELEEKTRLVEIVRNGSKQYCYYGIAAEKMIRKMAKVIVKEGSVSSEDYKEYRRLANGYRFNPQLPELSEEEEKKLSPFRDDSVGAVTNQKDCSPVKDNHPTEDNPEEVEVDEILERVRKALEEGHTVSIDYEM